MATKKSIAVFDIDGTIFRSSLLIELTKHLVRMSIFPKKAYQELKNEQLLWLDRKGSYEAYIFKVIQVFEKRIRNVPVSVLRRVTDEVLQRHKDRVYVFTREKIKQLKKTHVLLAISGSPDLAVQEFKRIWGFDAAYGTVYESKRGVYTGRVLSVASRDKKAVLQDFCVTHGIGLARSIGIGDTETDVSFLQMVKRPIAFNPNKKLLAIAKKKGWEVVVERKDVIYKI